MIHADGHLPPLAVRPQYLAFGTPDFTEAEIEAVARVMRSGWVGMGQETLAFERELAAYVGAPEVISVNSCTSALFLALLGEGVEAGDEVVVPSLTWCASANAALYLGATPVLCDVDAGSMSVTPDTILARLTPRTKAVVVVHYGGYAVDVQALRAALPPQVRIVEDAAHALGAHYPDGTPVGSSGNPVCFSFYANKNLSTAEGGAIALPSGEVCERLRRLRMNGMASNAWSRYVSPRSFASTIDELGYKLNFTDLQAAIGRVQLRRLDDMAAVRLRLAAHYRERLIQAGLSVPLQQGVGTAGHALHLLVGVFEPQAIGRTRDDLLFALRERNVGASVHYHPLHAMPLYRSCAPSTGLPVTDWLAERIMTLPISARMSLEEVDYVCEHLFQLMRTSA